MEILSVRFHTLFSRGAGSENQANRRLQSHVKIPDSGRMTGQGHFYH
jgi:hypothetical protein